MAGYASSCSTRLATAVIRPAAGYPDQYHQQAVQVVHTAVEAVYFASQLADFPVYMPVGRCHCLTPYYWVHLR